MITARPNAVQIWRLFSLLFKLELEEYSQISIHEMENHSFKDLTYEMTRRNHENEC